MNYNTTIRCWCLQTLLIMLMLPPTIAQNAGGNQGQNNQFPGGILINPDGLISSAAGQRINPALEQKRLKALAGRTLPSELATASELRKVSLNRLEQSCESALAEGREFSDAHRYLAGITQIHYVFAMPESEDVVIAGPAEGFAADRSGRVIGIETGRPVLTLQDLLTVLRIQRPHTALGCSFDPDPDRLASAQAWNKANSAPASTAVARQRFFQMAQVLGNWNVTIFGLPESGHAAITAVEADFTMKRIALGLDRPAVRGFLSHLEMARPGENTMRRWWFAPRYEVLERSTDGLAWRLAGPRLQLLSQEELVDVQGIRSDAPFKEVSAERYTKQFNRHMDALCAQFACFAGIQNLFDLSVVSALIRSERLAEQAGWVPGLFLDDERLPLNEFPVPREVPSLVNVKMSGRSLMIGLIGGGVTIVPEQVIGRTVELKPEQQPTIVAPAVRTTWWWD
ncbi:MAG: DUF1598 domain-containing protein [Planctomycetaceae bacterium]|nr:DUF1598 domain-containing protein [Planctomycetaceae bacterium]